MSQNGRQTVTYRQTFTSTLPATTSRMEAMLDSLSDTTVAESNSAGHKCQGNA